MLHNKNMDPTNPKDESPAPEGPAEKDSAQDDENSAQNEPEERAAEPAEAAEEPAVAAAPDDAPADAPDPLAAELASVKKALAAQEEKYLRLAAEYDNFRKRSQKERDGVYQDATASAVAAFLPVYDNLERALKQQTCDEAYAKGVEMTMSGLTDIMTKLGIEPIPALGQPFDPTLHNAVMHIEDGDRGENTIADVFQQGFKLGGKVIRCAMVKVAN